MSRSGADCSRHGPSRHPSLRVAGALATATALAACAASQPLVTNAIRTDLNSGGQKLADVERRFEDRKLQSLATSLPICIAYRMPAKAPWLTERFKQTLQMVGALARQSKGGIGDVQLLHARMAKDTAAVFPAEIAVRLTQSVRDQLPSLPVKYRAIPRDAFRAEATCGSKDTVFVDQDHLTFYSKDFPSDLAWSGQVHVGDLLFIRITGSEGGTAATHRKEAVTASVAE